MQEIPEVHADRSLDPNHIPPYETPKKKDGLVRPSNGPGRKRRQAVAAQSGSSIPNKRRNASRTSQPSASDSERESSGLTHEMNKRSRFDPAVSVVCALKSLASRSESASGVASEVSPSPLSTGTDQSVNDAEINKMWHYQDPTGKTQGPFTMSQLRKWNGSGHFPADLRIWRIDERREDSILLIEALNGNYIKQEPRMSSDDRTVNLNGSGNANSPRRDKNIADGSPNHKEEGPSSPPKPNIEDTNKVMEGPPSSEGRIITVAEVWNSLNDDAPLSIVQSQPQHCNSVQLPSNQDETSLQENESQESRQDNRNVRLFGLTEVVPAANNGPKSNEKRSDGDEPSGQLSGQNWNNSVPVTTIDSLDKSLETKQESKGITFPQGPTSAVGSHNEGVDDNAERNKQGMSSNLCSQDAAPAWSNAPSLVPEATQSKGVTAEWGGGYSSVPSKPVDAWDSTLGSGSSLRPTDMPGNNSALTLTSAQPTTVVSSQAHNPLPIESSWQAIVNETNDFASLGEESVSDLLAEVEAMENAGLPSPTSAMKCGHDLNGDSKDDCFSPIEGFDPTPGPVKSEVFTSTVELMVWDTLGGLLTSILLPPLNPREVGSSRMKETRAINGNRSPPLNSLVPRLPNQPGNCREHLLMLGERFKGALIGKGQMMARQTWTWRLGKVNIRGLEVSARAAAQGTKAYGATSKDTTVGVIDTLAHESGASKVMIKVMGGATEDHGIAIVIVVVGNIPAGPVGVDTDSSHPKGSVFGSFFGAIIRVERVVVVSRLGSPGLGLLRSASVAAEATRKGRIFQKLCLEMWRRFRNMISIPQTNYGKSA
ncbi:hypothetical protein CRG98_009582 [Punica granatum]|uniref:GYF domain-containing protein n=1 Tax=Punica granatum TaxID=22663 RepID=A0A2I0KNG0_PUNGR|nr:hypothetical protein CRG98_009582 [Punica granatum]